MQGIDDDTEPLLSWFASTRAGAGSKAPSCGPVAQPSSGVVGHFFRHMLLLCWFWSHSLVPPTTLQGKFDDAYPLYVRALEILAAAWGEDHPAYAGTLKLQAALLGKLVRAVEML